MISDTANFPAPPANAFFAPPLHSKQAERKFMAARKAAETALLIGNRGNKGSTHITVNDSLSSTDHPTISRTIMQAYIINLQLLSNAQGHSRAFML